MIVPLSTDSVYPRARGRRSARPVASRSWPRRRNCSRGTVSTASASTTSARRSASPVLRCTGISAARTRCSAKCCARSANSCSPAANANRRSGRARAGTARADPLPRRLRAGQPGADHRAGAGSGQPDRAGPSPGTHPAAAAMSRSGCGRSGPPRRPSSEPCRAGSRTRGVRPAQLDPAQRSRRTVPPRHGRAALPAWRWPPSPRRAPSLPNHRRPRLLTGRAQVRPNRRER